MEQSRLTELDALLDERLREFGDNFYYDKNGNAVKKKSGFMKKALIGGAALVGAASLAPLATRGGRARLGKKITTEWNKNSMRPKTGYSAFSAVADDRLREFAYSDKPDSGISKGALAAGAATGVAVGGGSVLGYQKGSKLARDKSKAVIERMRAEAILAKDKMAKMRKPIDKFASPLDAYRKSPKAKIASKFRGVVRRARKLV